MRTGRRRRRSLGGCLAPAPRDCIRRRYSDNNPLAAPPSAAQASRRALLRRTVRAAGGHSRSIMALRPPAAARRERESSQSLRQSHGILAHTLCLTPAPATAAIEGFDVTSWGDDRRRHADDRPRGPAGGLLCRLARGIGAQESVRHRKIGFDRGQRLSALVYAVAKQIR